MRLRYKPWAKKELEDNPLVYFDASKIKGNWNKEFNNSNPIHLDVGAGRGKFTYTMAEKNPDINYVALELDSKAFVYACRIFLDSGLDNIRAIKNIAQNLDQYFENKEVDKIYINFCNPWPKRSQHKRRLTHPRLLEVYKKILIDNGEIELKTDNKEFFDDSIKYFERNGFEIIYKTYDLDIDELEEDVITEYEEKWRGLNIPICYIKVRLEDR